MWGPSEEVLAETRQEEDADDARVAAAVGGGPVSARRSERERGLGLRGQEEALNEAGRRKRKARRGGHLNCD